MKRKDFLRVAAASSAAAVLPLRGVARVTRSGGCALVPTEIAGPFPLDLSDNEFFFRYDVREDREGAPHYLRMRIIGTENCLPMQNVRVNIWHCDAVGNYSGYGSQKGTTYLRGYQMTDANGEVEFLTIFPGWYPGRVCHFHFQVFVNSNYAAISQLTFDHDAVNGVYNDNPALYPDGEDPMTPETDGAFSDGYQYQLASLSPANEKGAYESFLEVAVEGSGEPMSISHFDKRTAQVVELGQNYPNPFRTRTTIPIRLHVAAQVELELWDISGRIVHRIDLGQMNSGKHIVPLDLVAIGLEDSSYLYQCNVETEKGRFTTVKRMTAVSR